MNDKGFNMTKEQLFDKIAKVVAHPHTTVTKHDNWRAAAIFLEMQEYFYNHTQAQEDCGAWIDVDYALDFDTFVEDTLTEEDLKEVGRILPR